MRSFNDFIKVNEEVIEDLGEKTSPLDYQTLNVTIGSTPYVLEMADTPEKITKGLSGRTSIPRKTGMIFVMPEETIQEFWMKDCLTDMDIIFLDSDCRVVNMHRMVQERKKMISETDMQYERQLKKYSSNKPAELVIELPPGDLTRLQLSVGQRVNVYEETYMMPYPTDFFANENFAKEHREYMLKSEAYRDAFDDNMPGDHTQAHFKALKKIGANSRFVRKKKPADKQLKINYK
jgi:uncharacterized membrane protein (UPF0127 family)